MERYWQTQRGTYAGANVYLCPLPRHHVPRFVDLHIVAGGRSDRIDSAETTLLGEVVLVSRDARAAEHAASAVCAGPCVLLALLERDYAKVPWLRARVAALLKQQRASPTRRMQRMHTQVRQQSAQSLTDAGPALDAFTVTNIT